MRQRIADRKGAGAAGGAADGALPGQRHRGIPARRRSQAATSGIGAGMRIGQLVLDVAPLRESRDFRWLYTGRFVASAGNVVATTAANWQVYALTHSPLAVGLLDLTGGMVLLVGLMAGGMRADRHDRRTLLLATGLPQALLARALMANSLLHPPALWAIYVITLAVGLLAGIGAPASTARHPGPCRHVPAAAPRGAGRGTPSATAPAP